MIVTFCGHRELHDAAEVERWLISCVETLLQNGATEFLLGGYGGFDRLAASVLHAMRQAYPAILSTLVLPYPDQKRDLSLYDGSVYPPLESVPRKYAIIHRNRWMVRQADALVAYVRYGWGGAAQTLDYARTKKKIVFLYPDVLPCHRAGSLL